MKNSVYFRRIRINAETGTATIIVSDAPLTQTQGKLAGMSVATQAQTNVTFGVLSLIDPQTGKVMRANHPTIKLYPPCDNRVVLIVTKHSYYA